MSRTCAHAHTAPLALILYAAPIALILRLAVRRHCTDGIRFPREFALLIKQVLYFDRYTSILAPGLDVMNDERLSMNRASPAAGQPMPELADEEAVTVTAEVLPPE